MTAAMTQRMAELEKENESSGIDEEDQVGRVWLSKLEYLLSVGDQENARALAMSKFEDKTTAKTHRIDAVSCRFYCVDC